MDENARVIELLTEISEKLGGSSVGSLAKQAEAAAKGLEGETKQRKINEVMVKQATDALTRFDKAVKSGRKKLVDLSPVIDQFEESLEEMTDGIEKSELEQKRNALASQYLTAQYRKAAIDISVSVSKVLVGGIAKTTGSFLKSMQGNAAGVNIAGEVLTNTIDIAQSGFSAVSKAGEAVGATLSSSTNPRLRKLGIATSLVSIGFEFLTSSMSKLAKFGVEILVKEVEKTIKSFHDISSTGAVFVDGMSGVRQAAHGAGLTVEQFSTVVKNNSGSLYSSGLGMGEAAKRIGNISKELRYGGASRLGQQLQNLGYGFEEQTDMIAQYTARLATANALRGRSDLELAQMSAQYAKDLRLLSAVTGEDAKKLAEDARLAAMQSDILAQLDPEQAKVFMAGFQALPKEARTAVLESVSSGGMAVTDAASNLMMAQIPGFSKLVSDFTSRVFSANLTETQMQEETLKQRALVGEEVRARLKAEGDAIGSANRLGHGLGGAAQALVELKNSFLLSTMTTAEQTALAIENNKAAANTTDGMTNLVNQAEATSQALKVAFEDRLTGPKGAITRFSKVTNEILDGLEKAMKKAGFDVQTSSEKASEKDIDWIKAGIGAAQVIGGVAMAATTSWTGVGLVGGGLMAAGGVKDIYDAFSSPGYASGGVVHRPELAMIGEGGNSEAVVPLPDNRSIPVTMTGNSMDTKEIISAINQQTGLLNRILVTMEKNNQLTSGILQTSY